jgi:hypothetical protein
MKLAVFYIKRTLLKRLQKPHAGGPQAACFAAKPNAAIFTLTTQLNRACLIFQ